MDQVHVIRHKAKVEGKSLRSIAKELGISRNTVKKYLGESAPRRKETSPRNRPVFEKVRSRLDALIEEWESRTTQKQRVTGRRLHRALREEGYTVGLTLIRTHLQERKRKTEEVFIPLIHRPGDAAQVDFFEVTVDVAGVRQKAWKFVMHLVHSGRSFVWLYERCDQVSFLDGHVRAFENFGGVPRRLIYDNLSAAVRKVLGGERLLTGRFLALVSHYLFEPCFARVGMGHDKGGVESRGKAIRLNHMVPIPIGSTLEAISTGLMEAIELEARVKKDVEGRTVFERFLDERGHMLEQPARAFIVEKPVTVSINRKSEVKIEGAVYSVPSTWANLSATAYVGVDELRVICRGEEVVHRRIRKGQRKVVYRHYLPELAKKPQAVRQVAPELIAELGEPFGKLWRLLVDAHGPRDAARAFARIIGAVNEQGEDETRDVIQSILRDDDMDSMNLFFPKKLKSTPQENSVPESLAAYTIEVGCTQAYDALLTGGAS